MGNQFLLFLQADTTEKDGISSQDLSLEKYQPVSHL